jgi:hypothetical protein
MRTTCIVTLVLVAVAVHFANGSPCCWLPLAFTAGECVNRITG